MLNLRLSWPSKPDSASLSLGMVLSNYSVSAARSGRRVALSAARKYKHLARQRFAVHQCVSFMKLSESHGFG